MSGEAIDRRCSMNLVALILIIIASKLLRRTTAAEARSDLSPASTEPEGCDAAVSAGRQTFQRREWDRLDCSSLGQRFGNDPVCFLGSLREDIRTLTSVPKAEVN
jgi:hypothetical protein